MCYALFLILKNIKYVYPTFSESTYVHNYVMLYLHNLLHTCIKIYR